MENREKLSGRPGQERPGTIPLAACPPRGRRFCTGGRYSPSGGVPARTGGVLQYSVGQGLYYRCGQRRWTKRGGGMAKAKVIREGLDLRRMDPQWSVRRILERNPLVWLVEVNGLPFDIREAPRRIQEEAYRRGLIPFLPDETPHADDGGEQGR